MTPREGHNEGAAIKNMASTSGSTVVSPNPLVSSKQDLLMRFFESDFFDSWIAVTYLHKSLSTAVHEYLCARLYTLPEADLERYLSQLCQLCVSRPDTQLENVLADLCARSLRIAVKTYWLLLAISQDQPRNEHVARLRDQCEQAGLEGHWDLPFKEAKLPSLPPGPGILQRFRRSASGSSWHAANGVAGTSPGSGMAVLGSSPLSVSTPPSLGLLNHADVPNGASPDAWPSKLTPWRSGTLSPDVPSRPLSPEGLGNGLHSSVFMDTGVEGLIYEGTGGLQRRNGMSPLGSASDLSVTPSALSLAPSGELPSSSKRRWGTRRDRSAGDAANGASPLADAGLEQSVSPPNSPRRRETTFGSTLDFVEALCTASSNLTVFQPEDRQWALHKALHSINIEMDRASAAGVAIWWPVGSSLRQRVVRLAYRESRLLNSREKAPFTLYVEVLNEAAAEAEAAAAAAAAAMLKKTSPEVQKLPPSPQEMELDPAAAEAAAEGIRWVPHHHRRSSSMDTAANSPLLAAAALAAVQGSSAAVVRTPQSVGAPWDHHSLVTPMQSREDSTGGDGTHPAGSVASLFSQRSEASTLAAELSLVDFVSDASNSPGKRPNSGGSGGAGSTEGAAQAAALPLSPVQLPPPLPSTSALPPLPRTTSLAQGGGTWIGGSNVRLHASHGASPLPGEIASGLTAALVALQGEGPLVAVHMQVFDDIPLAEAAETAAAAAVVAASPCTLSRAGTSSGGSSSSSLAPLQAAPAAEGAHAGGRQNSGQQLQQQSGSPSSAASSPRPQCKKNGWTCKLGLCKACNAQGNKVLAPLLEATLSQETGTSTAPEPVAAAAVAKPVPRLSPTPSVTHRPRVKVTLTVHGGLDLAIKRAAPRHQRMPSYEALMHVAKQHQLPPPALTDAPPAPSPIPAPAPLTSGTYAGMPNGCRASSSVHGEKWSSVKSRLRAASPHGSRPGWDVRCVIVKSGDDCRQELLAMQLIATFNDVFLEAQLPLFLRPYEVLVTSNRTALIEMVPNAPSIHTIKSRHPPGTSLRDHFTSEWGQGTPCFKRAQRNFVESLAAYSLVCYLLQIRDRHNGNILLDDVGHVIHIDFGFMLSNSPGGVNFESAPFKLTRELLEVMDSDPEGRPSELFDYFKVLLIQGFLAARKHSDRICLLVDMMSASGCPCFKNKVAAVQGLKKRFVLGLPEPAVVEVVLGLISDSLDAWRTRQYDYYQRVLNGIL